MVLITIGIAAALMLAGQTYVNPQRIMTGEQSETLLAERNRISLALRGYRAANGVPVSGPDWRDRVSPYLNAPLRDLPDGMSWLLAEAPQGGEVCLDAAPGVTLPPRTEPISCVLSGSAACYAPSSSGLIGEPGWTDCAGMLITGNALLRSAGSPVIGGDGSFQLTGPDAQVYTFASSERNVFTGQVTDLSDLFAQTAFNGDISYWVTSNVANMSGTFRDTSLFDQPIGSWDTSRTSLMGSLLEGALSFNRDLSVWCVPLIGAAPDRFDTGASSWVLDRPVWGSCLSEPVGVSVSLAAGSVPDGERDDPYPGFDFRPLASVTGADVSALTWSITSPPPGLSLSAVGVLIGTPTALGGFSFAVSAAHPGGASDTRAYSIIINDPDGALIVEP